MDDVLLIGKRLFIKNSKVCNRPVFDTLLMGV